MKMSCDHLKHMPGAWVRNLAWKSGYNHNRSVSTTMGTDGLLYGYWGCRDSPKLSKAKRGHNY